MIDLTAERGHFDTLLNLMYICQMLTQGCWMNQSSLTNLPHFNEDCVKILKDSEKVEHLCQLISIEKSGNLRKLLKNARLPFNDDEIDDVQDCLKKIPDVMFKAKLFDYNSDDMKPILEEGKKIKNKDEIYAVINARRINHEYPLKVTMKKFTKVKDFSWWIVVGNFEENKVYSLKKTFFKSTLTRDF